MNRPRDSSVSVSGNYHYAHSCVMHTSRGYYLRAALSKHRKTYSAAAGEG